MILSIDFDCFYVQCHQSLDKELRKIPMAVVQKHILCTVDYIARSKGVSSKVEKTALEETHTKLIRLKNLILYQMD